jgi:hypothetical protein
MQNKSIVQISHTVKVKSHTTKPSPVEWSRSKANRKGQPKFDGESIGHQLFFSGFLPTPLSQIKIYQVRSSSANDQMLNR